MKAMIIQLTALLVLAASLALAQTKPGETPAPLPYKSIITDTTSSEYGMITVHQLARKIFFEVPDSLIGRELLIVNRIARGSAELRAASAFPGDQVSGSTVRFEKGAPNEILLRQIRDLAGVQDTSSQMYANFQRANIWPIAATFKVAARSADNKGSVIEVTELLTAENSIFFLGNEKSNLKLSSLLSDRSSILKIKSFPNNLEILAQRTYSLSSGGTTTFEVSGSIVLLPKTIMRPRYYDQRIGYFPVSYTDFGLNPQGVKKVEMIKRWRMKPKQGDIERYKKGILVEPQKPVIYYIDPTTPSQWLPYIIAGVQDWQKAFESAGFKNAILARVSPKDKDWNLMGARQSTISYKPSEITNAMGSTLFDPRSGEILESHIDWHHNVMKILHDMYMIQAGAVDPRAGKMEFDEKLMGALVRYLVSHEVGHTLGLQHNFGSSATIPSELLRDQKYLAQHGFVPSVMDYARANYVAQPEDHVSGKGLIPGIGEYDLWAIEWGYRYFPGASSADQESKILNNLAEQKLKNERLWFASERSQDPRADTEDLGQCPMVSGGYGIKNLKRILLQLPQWVINSGQDYSQLGMFYDQIFNRYAKYTTLVYKNIGGTYENFKTTRQPGPVYAPVPAVKQRAALRFLTENVFTAPLWLNNQYVIDYTGKNLYAQISAQQIMMLNGLLFPPLLLKLNSAATMQQKDGYTATEMLDSLQQAIFPAVPSADTPDIYRRNLQKAYVAKLVSLVNPANGASPEAISIIQTDIGPFLWQKLEQLQKILESRKPALANIQESHFAELEIALKRALKDRKDQRE
jgi:hypothetical protein